MEQRKVLRKLTLNKEEIVNLNDFEMRNLKGGTGAICAIYESIQSVVQSLQGYQTGGELSLWSCEPTPTDSIERICYDGHNVCLLPTVYVNGLRP
jgi:natural product precursor